MSEVPLLAARVPLAPLTTLGVGGPARWFVRATTEDQLRAALTEAGERQLPLCVLGGGSNLVVADEGFQGLVVRMAMSGMTTSRAGVDTVLTAGAGDSWDGVVKVAVEQGLAGIECLSGIPGTVGGTPVQNVGAYGQEIAQVIDRVTAIDRRDGRLVHLAAPDCGFSYRQSRFKRADQDRFVITGVTLRLRPGPPTMAYPDLIAHLQEHAIMSPGVGDVREAVLAIRRRKGMVLDSADPDTRSVGSFFMNPIISTTTHAALMETQKVNVPSFPAAANTVKVPAAWLIEHAGFARGFSAGAVGVSTKHPLAIVTRGGADARDVVNLAVRIKRQVSDRFGISLRTEPVFVGFGADPDVAYLTQGTHVDTAD